MDIDFSAAIEQLQKVFVDSLNQLPNLIVGTLIAVITFYLAKYLRDLVRRLVKSAHRPESLGVALGRITRWTTITVGLLIATLVIFPGFTAGQLIQLLGVGSLAVGIAFRNIFEDFFAGILLLLNEPFTIGDQIVLDGYEGTIENIQARVTFIRTYDGRRIVVPNGDLFTKVVVVNTAYPFRRIEYDIGIGYGDDIAEAQRVILETLRVVDDVEAQPPPEAILVELADYSVVLRARWWIKPPRRSDAVDTRNRALTQIRAALLAHGIDMPFPTQQILFHDQTEATDGDRRRQREGWPFSPEKEMPEPRRIIDGLHVLAAKDSESHFQEGEEPE
jgi:small-conductance mechanosensitive channel